MYELRQLVVEPKRRTYRPVQERIGDRNPTRYEEATIGVQSTELFHYRPLWDPAHELYDPSYSKLRLNDPDAFLDPRQFYYASFVQNRAQRGDSLAQMVEYVQQHDMAGSLSPQWGEVLASVVMPLRHYEAGANLISINGARFAWGTAIASATGFAAMDRLSNAQLLTEGGLTLGGVVKLAEIKASWTDDTIHQPARKLIEELLCEPDWAVGVIALDQLDELTYALLYGYLERVAFQDGVLFYSLVAPFLRTWYEDQSKWIGALKKAWIGDPEHGVANAAVLADVAQTWGPAAHESALALASRIDELLGGAGATEFVTQQIKESQQ